MFRVCRLKLENNIFLAPMAGVTNSAFRIQCKKHGAGLVFSPLMDEDGVIEAFDRFNDFIKDERPIGGQLVGTNPITLSEAAKIIESFVDLIDINFGCPDKDVLAKKSGAYHIKHPEKIHKIISSLKDVTKLPVTAKIRIGWDSQSLNHIKVSKLIEDAGVDMITVHGRTKEQGYSGRANWTAIKQVKEKIEIPVIGNGDANSPEKVKEMLDFTGCDGVMIGRAAMGNPWIFKKSFEYLRNGEYDEVNEKEKIEGFFEFLEIYNKYQNRKKFSEVKTHALWFTKGLTGSKGLRQKILKTKDEKELRLLLSRQ